ncbi:MAG: hypothetical protein IH600_10690 [Bacteroidetes bacterium]|nr:hypothetical protein [Bacteroidota bacterium]
MSEKVFFIALLLFPGLMLAQTASHGMLESAAKSQRFDPAVYFSTVHINQMYGHGDFPTPEGMRMTLVDTIWANQRALGFSMQFTPVDGTGWQMWLDFDADVYYRPRLVRIIAQRPIEKGKTDAFASYRDWVSSVQSKNIGAPVMKEAERVRWPWLTRTAYFLTLKQESLDDAPWLLLVLQREEK